MNKVYTIGRDPSCDIVVNDNTDVVSRVHASLKDIGHGKYILVDQSRNGTYVNGIKMSSNEEVPVTRKDVISFAHVCDLDWNQIPVQKSSWLKWLIIGILLLIVIGCLLFFLLKKKDAPVDNGVDPVPTETVVEVPDSSDTKDVVRDTVYIKEKTPAKEKRKVRETTDKVVTPPAEEKKTEEEPVIDALY